MLEELKKQLVEIVKSLEDKETNMHKCLSVLHELGINHDSLTVLQKDKVFISFIATRIRKLLEELCQKNV